MQAETFYCDAWRRNLWYQVLQQETYAEKGFRREEHEAKSIGHGIEHGDGVNHAAGSLLTGGVEEARDYEKNEMGIRLYSHIIPPMYQYCFCEGGKGSYAGWDEDLYR